MKTLAKIALATAAFVVVALAVGLAFRAFRQHQNAETLAIRTPNGISEAKFVKVGGIEQWIQIRGEDRANPVILFVHGGPGMSVIPFVYRTMRPWERDFTIVHWDQRAAGRTQMHNRGDIAPTLEHIISDGIGVTEYLRAHLHVDKVIIVGASWGSMVGIEMARQRPDLYYAYVGTGQVIDDVRTESVGYKRLLERVRAAGDQSAVAALEHIGRPPYSTAQLRAERQILTAHPPASERGVVNAMLGELLFAPGYSLRDDLAILGTQNVPTSLMHDLAAYDARTRGTRFAVPMFFFQGSDDIQAPTELVQSYFASITAPQKQLVLFPGAGHMAVGVYGARFLQELDARVRPLATATVRRGSGSP